MDLLICQRKNMCFIILFRRHCIIKALSVLYTLMDKIAFIYKSNLSAIPFLMIIKRMHLVLFFSVYLLNSFAQKADDRYLPEIKARTLFQYVFKGKNGSDLNVSGEILSTDKGSLAFVDTLKFEGKIQINKTMISKTAMENANKMRSPNEQPTSAQNGNSLFVLPDDKTDHCFSRRFFKTLMDQKSASYSGITYNLTPISPESVFKLNGKEVDAIYIVSANGQKKFWILNNPLYPFILQSASENVNATLTGIRNK